MISRSVTVALLALLTVGAWESVAIGDFAVAPRSALAGKTLKELTANTRGLPWNKLWDEGTDGATKALARLRNGEKIVPDGLGREALEAYGEIARRALANPTKATEVQRLRLQIIEELLKGLGG